MTLDDWMDSLEREGPWLLGPLSDWAEDEGREDAPFWQACRDAGWFPYKDTSNYAARGGYAWDWRRRSVWYRPSQYPSGFDGCHVPEDLFERMRDSVDWSKSMVLTDKPLNYLEHVTLTDAYAALSRAWLELATSPSLQEQR